MRILLAFPFTVFVCLVTQVGCRPVSDADPSDWPVYLGDAAASHFSSLDQIDRNNVHRLQVAWTYSTGDKTETSQIQCNPLVVRGRLYATSPALKAFCLDAATGREIWVYDPVEEAGLDSASVNRGLVHWEEGSEQRIVYPAGHLLIALDAGTGLPVPSFGDDGRIDLRTGLGRGGPEKPWVVLTTPPALYRDLLIAGSRVGEGPGPAAPGHIRAFDVRTGQLRWTFHTIPRPGEKGHETWPADAWTYAGGANAWAGMTVDRERGIVYAATGSPSFDFWGGDRQGKNLYGDCVLAIAADSGELRWHFQALHHDLWDRDLPAAPNLVRLSRNGRPVDAVAQITKWGDVFVLDRETGEPLFPVEERPAPPSDLEGEQAWPTQPFPLKPPPFSRQSFTEADVTDLSPRARAAVLERFRQVRRGHMYEPPSTQGTLVFPGFNGGAEWGGAAFDAANGRLYVNSTEMPWILTMVSTKDRQLPEPSPGARVYQLHCANCHGDRRQGSPRHNNPPLPPEQVYPRKETRDLIRQGIGRMAPMPQLSDLELDAVVDFLAGADADNVPPWAVPEGRIPYTFTGYNHFLDPDGYPAIKPPWGQLTALDLNAGTLVWQVPLGRHDELTERGIPPTGTTNYGGPVVTAGGLLFIGATMDERFRAFDTDTGKVLWETRLPAGGYATPATYAIRDRQYVVIAAGGGKMGTPSGDAYVAFALPEGTKGDFP